MRVVEKCHSILFNRLTLLFKFVVVLCGLGMALNLAYFAVKYEKLKGENPKVG
jgi:hypothetical protein